MPEGLRPEEAPTIVIIQLLGYSPYTFEVSESFYPNSRRYPSQRVFISSMN